MSPVDGYADVLVRDCREAVADLERSGCTDPASCRELCESFAQLDSHLARGGKPPQEWDIRRRRNV